ncbi:MAG: hypothetical protein CVV24_05805 [Ignavibacteriae bacterium HGW-Ignavibacteriae-3]|nr:MAG: hypothetical protein CVV24_05805 [Ignavibacteriae bacterium HGW-Ignavibacteriae-3]
MPTVREIIPVFKKKTKISIHFLYDYMIYYPGLLDKLRKDSKYELSRRNFILPKECKFALNFLLKNECIVKILRILLAESVPFGLLGNEQWIGAWIKLHKNEIEARCFEEWQREYQIRLNKTRIMKTGPCPWNDCPPGIIEKE